MSNPPANPSANPPANLPANPTANPTANPPANAITSLSLPLEGVFDTFDADFRSCQDYAKLAGYSFTIGKSDKKQGRAIKILICKRGGKHRTSVQDDYRQRKRLSFKTGCQFVVKVRQRADQLIPH
jgi:hypothetical protein